jgi:hypothetical protein
MIILLWITALAGNVNAQEAFVEARLDTNKILIGDQINLNISFSMPLDYRVIWPFFQDTLTRNLEIISQTPVDTMKSESDNLVNMIQSITITSFDSGRYYIPPIRVQYQPIDDTSFSEVSSIPLWLEVQTMEVDTTKAIKAIKPPLKAPFSIREILPWILMSLAAIIITLIIVYVITRIKRKQPVFAIRPKPALPPDIIAIDGLQKLKAKKLWQAGKVKDYYTELTDILRKYIEDRLDVQAIEMTTDEIIDGLKGTDIDNSSINKLFETLFLADLVKFAKEKPMPLDNEKCMNNGVDFINETRMLGKEDEETKEGIAEINNTEKEEDNNKN